MKRPQQHNRKSQDKWITLSLAIVGVCALLYGVAQMGWRVPGTGMASAQIGNFSVSISTYLSCTWSGNATNISFGTSLNPGTTNNATYNFYSGEYVGMTLYNVTVDTLSNVNADMEIQGVDLMSGANTIKIGNVSWASNSTNSSGIDMIYSNGHVVLESYDTGNKVGANQAPGSTTHYRFWITIPSGQVGGNYVGNYTMQCQQAA